MEVYKVWDWILVNGDFIFLGFIFGRFLFIGFLYFKIGILEDIGWGIKYMWLELRL